MYAIRSYYANIISPEVGSSRRFIHRNKVDFPEPDEPIIDTTSPSYKSRLIPFSYNFV